ncbi:MAG TPA: hypothetical protein VER11_10935 [Polyangiaceae bacterium]|nr:hypothetical protein [Polyangiaceae bacterium]
MTTAQTVGNAPAAQQSSRPLHVAQPTQEADLLLWLNYALVAGIAAAGALLLWQRTLSVAHVAAPDAGTSPLPRVSVSAPVPAAPTASARTLDQAYEAAIVNARDPSSNAVNRELMPVRSDTAGLEWDPSPTGANARVLVTAWSGYDGYRKHEKRACRLSQAVWVTPVPQMRRVCAGFGLKGAALEQRLNQYLGLPPGDSSGRRIVELWVSPKQLFRPCPDPEIDDRECRLGVPLLSDPPTPTELGYSYWFLSEYQQRYSAKGGYPWTRLGYTYDWADSSTHVGASEYVVRGKTSIWIASVSDTETYCSDATLARSKPASEPLSTEEGC